MDHQPPPVPPPPRYSPPKARSPAMVEYVPDSEDEEEASTGEVDGVTASSGPQVCTTKYILGANSTSISFSPRSRF